MSLQPIDVPPARDGSSQSVMSNPSPQGERTRSDERGWVMAQAREELQTGALYMRYVEALRRHGKTEEPQPSPGHVVRYCHSCGMRAMFRLDPDGNWYECLHCRHYA